MAEKKLSQAHAEPSSEARAQARLNALWREIQLTLADSAWSEAEGLLRRFIQLGSGAPVEVWDTLAYTLLMQGDYQACLNALAPWVDHPERSFWLRHKQGDALRGLNQLEPAVEAYRRSLRDGSDSPLTWRNLLQCLDGLAPERAVAELEACMRGGSGVLPAAGWEGARAAALLVPGLELAELLLRCGEADAACRRRLVEHALYTLDLPGALAVLNGDGLNAWEQALVVRLRGVEAKAELGRTPAASGPGAGARCC